jgi:hypothetical protein
MDIAIVHAALAAAGSYAAIGVLTGVPFVIFGVGRIDRAADSAPWAFRVLVLPGVIAMWPLMMRRWWASRRAR